MSGSADAAIQRVRSGAWIRVPGSAVRRFETDLRLVALAVIGGAGFVYCQARPPGLAPLAVVLALCLLRFPGRTLIAVWAMSAAWSAFLVSSQLADRWPVARSGEVVSVTGRVVGLPQPGAVRTRFELERQQSGQRLRLSWYDDAPALVPGDCVHLRAKLETPHGSANPGMFDYEAWLWRRGIDATGYVKTGDKCRGPPAGAVVDRLRARALTRIDAALGDAPMRGIIEAITLGARNAISDGQWDVLRATGTSHLVAISGLHVGLIAMLAFVAARWISLRLAPRLPAVWPATAVAFSLALGYALLAGFALPTQRALVMVTVGLLAVAAMRRVSASRMLALAAIAVTVWQPAAVIAPGFWLSFAAVAWLLYLARRAADGRWLLLARIQFGLVLGLMPLTLWFFGQASLISPLVNALLIPLATIVVPALLAVTLLTLTAPALGAPLLLGCAKLLGAGWPLLAAAADWPLASVHAALPGVIAVLLTALAVALLLMPRGLPGRTLAPILVLPAIFGWQPADSGIADGAYRVTLLDVGQGLATVVRTRGHTLVFDTGPRYRSGFNAGSAFVVPYLRYVDRASIDMLVVSHADIDHIGGARAIEAALAVRARRGARSPRACRAGQHWRWDGVTFEFLYPSARDAETATRRNQRSCVLRVRGRAGTTLFTGDMEAAAERTLLRRRRPSLAADILVVAHHGSDSSSTAPFLAAVSPRIALISAGWQNRWGFPAPAVSARLRAAGATIANTAVDGALSVHVGATAGGIKLSRWRRVHARFWQTP